MNRLGILGAGCVAPAHLLAAAKHPKAIIVHIADVYLEAARKLADEYGVDRVSKDAQDVVVDNDVDTVVIALPTFLHYDWLLRCAKAGKNILCEKPLCRTVSQGRRAIRACAQQGVRLAVGYQRRFSPARIMIRKLVQAGKLGCPVTWTISNFAFRPDWHGARRNQWVWDKNSGGLVTDWAIHAFDFACWVLGKPVKMFAQSRQLSSTVTSPTQAAAFVHFENGDNLVYGASWQEKDFGWGRAPESIVGPKGTIVLDSDSDIGAFTWYHAPGKKKQYTWELKQLKPYYAEPAWDWMLYKQMASFLGGKKEDPSLTSGEGALASLWIAEKIIDAGPEGKLFRFR